MLSSLYHVINSHHPLSYILNIRFNVEYHVSLFSFLRNTATQTDPNYLVEIITLTAVTTVRELQSRQPTRPEMNRAVLASLDQLSDQMERQTRILRQIRAELRVANSTRINNDQLMDPRNTD